MEKRGLIEELKTDMCEYAKNIGKYISDRKWIIIGICFFALLAYGYEVTNMSLSKDEEYYLFAGKGTLPIAFIRDGRWGIAILSVLLSLSNPQPFWEMLLTVIFLTVSAIAMISMYEKKIENKIGAFCAGVIFVVMPIHCYWQMFQSFSVEIACGFVFSVFGADFIMHYAREKKYDFLLIGAIFISFAVGIYQSFILLCVELMINIFIIECMTNEKTFEGKDVLKKILYAGSGIACSMFIYYLVKFISQIFFSDNGYTSDQIMWGKKDISIICGNIKEILYNTYISPNTSFVGGWVLLISYFIIILCAVLYLIKYCNNRIYVVGSLMISTFLLSALELLLGQDFANRTKMTVASYCAFAFFLLVCLINDFKMGTIVATIITVVMGFYMVSDVNSFFYSTHIRRDNDFMTATNMLNDIEEYIVDNEIDSGVSVAFVGYRWEPFVSNLYYDGEESYFNMPQYRIYYYLESLGVECNRPCEEDLLWANEYAIENMDIWPDEDCMQYFPEKHMIIVRIGVE